jgi:DNA-binding transcriptional MerR regulator
VRISELGQATGVPVHTLKFYLREGILMPGRTVSRTRADYGPEHVERVRLVRALVEQGGVAIAGVRSILEALDAPPPSRHDLLGVAACAMPTTAADHPVDPEAVAVVDGLGWQVAPDSPAFRSLSAALSAADAAGVGLSPGLLRDYALAVHGVAEVDLGVAERTTTPEEALRTVVIGTVMLDPVLVALRRVAQEAVSAERS